MDWYEFLQTMALCVGALSLLVIAVASVVLALRMIAMVTPFDLLPLEDEPIDDEEYIVEEVMPPNRKERRRRKKGDL